jgi:hypothetical protein
MNSVSSTFEQFGYSWKDRLQDHTILWVIFASCLLLYVFLRSLVGLFIFFFLLSTAAPVSSNLEEVVIGLTLTVWVLYFMLHQTLNLFPIIRTNQYGMEIQVFEKFQHKWKAVSWESLRALYPVVKFGWLYDHTGRCVYVVEVDNLSVWHRQLSLMIGNGNNHAIVLNQGFPKREALLDKIREHLPE